MDSFEQWWAKEHPVYDSGNNTVQEHTAAQKGWEAGYEAGFSSGYDEGCSNTETQGN